MAGFLAKFFDPGNIWGLQGNPYDQLSTGGAYEFSPAAFQMGTQNIQQYGGQAQQMYGRDPALNDMLMAQAMGTAPSAAEIQMQDALRRNQAASMGLAASQRGVAPGLALRQAQQSNAQMGMQTSVQAAALRAQEQQAGRAMLLQQQAQNDQMVRYFTSLGYSLDEAKLKAAMALQSAQYNAYEANQNRQLTAAGAKAGYEADKQAAATAGAGAIFGGIFGGAGAAATTQTQDGQGEEFRV